MIEFFDGTNIPDKFAWLFNRLGAISAVVLYLSKTFHNNGILNLVFGYFLIFFANR